MQSSTYASTLALAAAFMAAIGPEPLLAQDAAPPENEETDRVEGQIDIDSENLIVVTAPRLRGQLDVDQPPIAEFNAEDIAAFGAGSIADVLEAIAPATQSGARGGRGGGRPVFLVNGIRVSSPREFSNYPPEAIEKVEVFPEEVAQRFGYSADQRVVNIILKNNFQAVTAEVEYAQPDRGGFSRNEQEATYLRIGENGRLNFNVEVEDTSLLTEGERGLTIAGSEDEAFFRSLIADSLSAEATANYVRAFMDSGASLSLNGSYNHSESLSLSGLVPGTIDPIERRNNTDTASFATTLSGVLGDWRSTYTGDAVFSDGRTEIERRDGTGFDIADSRTWSFVNKATFIGNPLLLPAGEVTTTLDLGFDWRRIESSDTRADSDLELTRRRL
ncbi:MAG: TonB-dependent receptor plug domain-containing protein, partial [Pseudomonadota bacterium]|nr:TonB-dependent receptor plug domain-containing protein [Pseudomonadota bacterium]